MKLKAVLKCFQVGARLYFLAAPSPASHKEAPRSAASINMLQPCHLLSGKPQQEHLEGDAAAGAGAAGAVAYIYYWENITFKSI